MTRPTTPRPSDLVIASYYIALAAVVLAILAGLILIGGMLDA